MRERERERVCVRVCVCERERERVCERECVCERERDLEAMDEHFDPVDRISVFEQLLYQPALGLGYWGWVSVSVFGFGVRV